MEKRHPLYGLLVILLIAFLAIGFLTHILWLTTLLAVMCYLLIIFVGWQEIRSNIANHVINERLELIYLWYVILEIMMGAIFIGFLFVMFKQYQETVSFILPSAMLNAFALQYYLKMGNNHKSAKKVVSRKIVRRLLPVVLVGNPLLVLSSSYMMSVDYTILGIIALLLWLALIFSSSILANRYDIKE